MKSKIKLKTFDWAMKRLLHSKANLGILEGFLTEQLKEDITILDIQDSQRYLAKGGQRLMPNVCIRIGWANDKTVCPPTSLPTVK